MQTAREMLEALSNRRDLTETQAGALLGLLAEPTMDAALAGAILAALRVKGVTATEVRGFAGAMRSRARKLDLPDSPNAIDLVGTGGDASGSLNLSTGAALLTAACGMPVIKHGNRSISSRSGSADFIEQMGLRLPLDEDSALHCLNSTGFTFLFAPYFHPSMRNLATVRTALGIRTIFNLLGPLTNPAAPRFQLIGAYDAAAAELLANSVAGMEVERAWIVHGAQGWDEATPMGPFLAYDVTRDRVQRLRVDPREFGLDPCDAAALAGGDAAANAAAFRDVLEGRDRGPHLAALTLQAGLALHIAGRAPSIMAGIGVARGVVESGAALTWLTRLREVAEDLAARGASAC
jgi:anthranilate phosphoribosyltransferase